MENQEHYARLKYYKEYGDRGEGFAIELRSEEDNEWGLDIFCPCYHRKDEKEGEEADYVHFSLAKELAKLAEYGYHIFIAKS